MRPGTRESRFTRFFARALGACLLLSAVGCGLFFASSPPGAPSVAGVVVEVARLPDGGVTYGLQNGESVEIPSQKRVLLGGEPLVGELLLAGSEPDGSQWVAGVSQSPNANDSGCFWLTSNGKDVADQIETTDGIRLRKASDFDPGLAKGGDYSSPRGYFCLNEKGEVSSYVSA